MSRPASSFGACRPEETRVDASLLAPRLHPPFPEVIAHPHAPHREPIRSLAIFPPTQLDGAHRKSSRPPVPQTGAAAARRRHPPHRHGRSAATASEAAAGRRLHLRPPPRPAPSGVASSDLGDDEDVAIVCVVRASARPSERRKYRGVSSRLADAAAAAGAVGVEMAARRESMVRKAARCGEASQRDPGRACGPRRRGPAGGGGRCFRGCG